MLVFRLRTAPGSYVWSSIATRAYARGRSLVRQPPRKASNRDVWVDPFKSPPPPRPNFRVLIKPAIFTAIVLLSADYVADHFVEQRTSQVTTRAQRNAETAWTIWPMIGTNVLVFGLWRAFPSLLHRIGGLLVPYAPTPSQLVVNTFSHQEIWHLLLNQVALYSFGSLVCDTIGREHFLSLYLQAACVSSLTSISATQLLVSRGVFDISHLTRGSLGASGVIYSMLGISAIIYPEMRIGVIFLPLSFPIKYAFPSLCAVDVAGLIAKWSRFDHVCHVLLL
jgi:rhomboid-like protein